MHVGNNIPRLRAAPLALSCKAHLSRHREKPKRPIQIWSMDVSKQVLSMLVAHVCGVFLTAFVTSSSICQCSHLLVAYVYLLQAS